LQELAKGKTTNWVPVDETYPQDNDEPMLVPVRTLGILKPRFPAMRRDVGEVQGLLLQIAAPLLESEAQITVLVAGLDRLIRPERFREFAEQDLRALKSTKISVVVATPLLLWFDKSRFIQDYFDDVKHIPAAITGPAKIGFS
jgi:hypothetical protein